MLIPADVETPLLLDERRMLTAWASNVESSGVPMPGSMFAVSAWNGRESVDAG